MSIQSTEFGSSETHSRQMPRGWPLVLLLVGALTVIGWTYLAAMIADMVPRMDMSDAGPGMIFFNQFNLFNGLPAEARAALAALCLPTAATFGMPDQVLTPGGMAAIYLMWMMMVFAMMTPGAVPMLRAFAVHLGSKGTDGLRSVLALSLVLAGYVLAWALYAVVATLLQVLLQTQGAMNEMMAPLSLSVTTSVLFAAGLYQFTPAKAACLERCWSPRWVFGKRSGVHWGSAFGEGLRQGGVCLGCCWAVMALMFAVGVMNVIWIALLGGIMTLEKVIPSLLLPKLIGAFLLAWAALLATVSLL